MAWLKVKQSTFLKEEKNYDHILLKIKNKSDSNWANFNLFPFVKHTVWSWVDFSQLSDLKRCPETWVICVNSSLIKIKNALSEVSVYWIYNRICALDDNARNDFTGIEPALLNLATELKLNALTIRPRKHVSIRNNEKYIDRRSNFVATSKKIMND